MAPGASFSASWPGGQGAGRGGRGGAGPPAAFPPRPARTPRTRGKEKSQREGGAPHKLDGALRAGPYPTHSPGARTRGSPSRNLAVPVEGSGAGARELCSMSYAPRDVGVKAVTSPGKCRPAPWAPGGPLGLSRPTDPPAAWGSSLPTERAGDLEEGWGLEGSLQPGLSRGLPPPGPPPGPPHCPVASCAAAALTAAARLQPEGKESLIEPAGRAGRVGEVEPQWPARSTGEGRTERRDPAGEEFGEKAECGRAPGDVGGTEREGGERAGVQAPLAKHFFGEFLGLISRTRTLLPASRAPAQPKVGASRCRQELRMEMMVEGPGQRGDVGWSPRGAN